MTVICDYLENVIETYKPKDLQSTETTVEKTVFRKNYWHFLLFLKHLLHITLELSALISYW